MGLAELLVEQIVYGLVTGSIYAMVAVGLSMIFGVMRFSNFAHGEFYMLGAYLTYTISRVSGLDPYLATPLAGLSVGLLGIALNKTLIRPLYEAVARARGSAMFYFQDLNFILMTIGLSVFIVDLVLVVWRPVPIRVDTVLSDATLDLFGVRIGAPRLVALAVAVSSLVSLQLFLKKTRLGKAIRAVSQDPASAMLSGVNIWRVYDVVMFLSLLLAGVAGGVVGPMFNLYPNMGLDMVVKAFVVVILGGMGSVTGSIYAGFLLGVVENLGGLFLGTEYRDVIGFLIMIAVLWARPRGIAGG